MVTQVFKHKTYSRTIVKNNILRVWKKTQSNDRVDWYGKANDFCIRIGLKYNLTSIMVAGVVASLSPVKTWEQNLKIAENMVRSGDCGHMGQFKQKAKDILASDGSKESILKVLNGRKISSFFLNIIGDTEPTVTIDRHALSIALRLKVTDEMYRGMTQQQYEFFVECYKMVAKVVNEKPTLIQSATWVYFRKQKEIN